MSERSKVTAEQTMPVGRTRSESRARSMRPLRAQATERIRERTIVTEVQVQGLASHDHDDRYVRIDGPAHISAAHVAGGIWGSGLAVTGTVRALNLSITGNKNGVIRGTPYGDLYFAATESDRARYWIYIEADPDEPMSDIMARLPGEFASVTQAPYWVSFEQGYDLDGSALGTWARVTADVRDDLGPQQAPYGKRKEAQS